MNKHSLAGFDIAPAMGFAGLPPAYGPKVYRMAKEGAFANYPFGPLFTLDRGQFYQSQMNEGGFPVLLINTETGKGF